MIVLIPYLIFAVKTLKAENVFPLTRIKDNWFWNLGTVKVMISKFTVG